MSQAVSLFPNIPDEKPYDEIIQPLLHAFEAKFDHYSNLANEIDGKTKEWEKDNANLKGRSVEELRPDFTKKLDLYITYRRVRNGTESLKDQFSKTIFDCQPPILDVSTLLVCKKLKGKITDFKTKYDKTFTTQLNQLVAQNKKLEELFNKIRPSLANLRVALEPLARACSNAGKWTLSNVLFTTASQTPYVNAAVAAREAELALLKQPDSEEQKVEESKTEAEPPTPPSTPAPSITISAKTPPAKS